MDASESMVWELPGLNGKLSTQAEELSQISQTVGCVD